MMRLPSALMYGTLAACLLRHGSHARSFDSIIPAPLPLAASPFPANQSEVSTTRHSEENEVSHDEKEERGFPARFGIPEALETNGAHGADELSVEETDKVLEVLQPIAQNFFVKQPDQLKDVEDWEEFILGVELASSSSQTTFSEKLAAKCSYNELLQIIAAGKELRVTGTRAHAVEKELRVTGTRDHAAEKELRVTGKRAHAAEKTVDDVLDKVCSLELWLKKNYPTNKLKQLVRTRTEEFFRKNDYKANWIEFFSYVKAYNEQIPGGLVTTTAETIMKFYKDELMVEWISEFFEPITEKDLAINQLNELYSRQQKWLKLKKHPDDVFSEVGLAEPLWTMFEPKTMGYKLRRWRRNTNDFIKKYPKMPATVRAYFPYEDKQLLKMLFYESSEHLHSNILKTQVLKEVTEALHKTNPDLFELYELFCLDMGGIEVFSSRRMMNWLQFAKKCKPPVSPIPVLLKKNGFGEKDYDKLYDLVSEAPGSKSTKEIQRLLQIESKKAKKK